MHYVAEKTLIESDENNHLMLSLRSGGDRLLGQGTLLATQENMQMILDSLEIRTPKSPVTDDHILSVHFIRKNAPYDAYVFLDYASIRFVEYIDLEALDRWGDWVFHFVYDYHDGWRLATPEDVEEHGWRKNGTN